MVGVGKKVSNKRKIFSLIIFVVGFILCSYPLVASLIEQRYLSDTVATYEKDINNSDDGTLEEERLKAEEYNDMLFQSSGILVSGINDGEGILSEESYNSILNISNTGVMGSIEIPKINVNLPIYHGTSDDTLNSGVGHLEKSSLPIGGENTRTVLTGHRGLPNSKLFTRLDELELGDLFFIRVLNETLAYQVCDIEVIVPEEVDKLSIREGEDLVTLVTCTPYGINTHRLLVTGERIAYEKATYESIESEPMSVRELFFTVIPFVLLLIGIVTIVSSNIKNKKKKLEVDEHEEKD